jgi:TolB-like protein/DNA-binding winged helix-turn-helix (wHTH) protein
MARENRVGFGPFVFDPRSRELCRGAQRVLLPAQPASILRLLLERRGQVVTREELQRQLWPDTNVDSERGLNAAIKRLRRALGDSAQSPTFVETLPRIGYRFIASQTAPENRPFAPPAQRRPRLLRLALLATLLLVLSGWLAAHRSVSTAAPRRVRLAVMPFHYLSYEPEPECFRFGLTEELTGHIAALDPQRLGVIAQQSLMRYQDELRPAEELQREFGVDYVLEGSVRVAAGHVQVNAQLIRASDRSYLWAQTFETLSNNPLDVERQLAARIGQAVTPQLLALRN